MEHLTRTISWQHENKIIEKYLKEVGDLYGEPLRILEAGCGTWTSLPRDAIRCVLTGIDKDKTALNARTDLDVIVEGDLRDVDLEFNQFDAIYCSFVLEHIYGAREIIVRFFQWLKPGGIVILRIPDRNHVHSFIARMSPYWFHVFFYRRILRVEQAGKPGFPPYPTCFDSIISCKGIRKFCETNGVAVRAEYGSGFYNPGKGLFRLLIVLITRIIGILSLGSLSYRTGWLLYVLQKGETAK